MPVVLKNKNVLVISGDVSGDFYASALIRELKNVEPSLVVYSIGGLRSKEVSDKFIYDVVSKGVFGFVSSIKSLGLWVKLISIVRRLLEEKKPAFVVCIDFFGFNRQVLGLCKNRDIPVYYFIPPQVWASRPKRAKTVASISKRIYPLFPFEVDIYEKLDGDVKYFGHPLGDFIPLIEQPKKYPLDNNKAFKIGILPGSRKNEIENHLKVFIEVFNETKKDFPNSVGYVFMVDEFDEHFYRGFLQNDLKDIFFVRDRSYAFRSQMDFCLTCSGTATLENAMLSIPMVVGYKTSFLNYEIARAFINLPYISLPNIVLGREVVKEFIQYNFRSGLIHRYVRDILSNKQLYEDISKSLFEIRKLLSPKSEVIPSIAKDIISDYDIV